MKFLITIPLKTNTKDVYQFEIKVNFEKIENINILLNETI